jgi:ketosteroid isomerase-like protein
MSGTTDERSVLEAFDALDDAFAGRDVTAVLDLFVADDDVVFVGSARAEQALGRAELHRVLHDLFGLPEVTGGSFEIDWSERRVRIAEGVAWVTATGEATWTSPRRTLRFPYRLTGVLLHREGRWLWHTHHGSEPGSL